MTAMTKQRYEAMRKQLYAELHSAATEVVHRCTAPAMAYRYGVPQDSTEYAALLRLERIWDAIADFNFQWKSKFGEKEVNSTDMKPLWMGD